MVQVANGVAFGEATSDAFAGDRETEDERNDIRIIFGWFVGDFDLRHDRRLLFFLERRGFVMIWLYILILLLILYILLLHLLRWYSLHRFLYSSLKFVIVIFTLTMVLNRILLECLIIDLVSFSNHLIDYVLMYVWVNACRARSILLVLTTDRKDSSVLEHLVLSIAQVFFSGNRKQT